MVAAFISVSPNAVFHLFVRNQEYFELKKSIEQKWKFCKLTRRHRETTLMRIRSLSYGGLSDVYGGIVWRGTTLRRGVVLKTIIVTFDSSVSSWLAFRHDTLISLLHMWSKVWPSTFWPMSDQVLLPAPVTIQVTFDKLQRSKMVVHALMKLMRLMKWRKEEDIGWF